MKDNRIQIIIKSYDGKEENIKKIVNNTNYKRYKETLDTFIKIYNGFFSDIKKQIGIDDYNRAIRLLYNHSIVDKSKDREI